MSLINEQLLTAYALDELSPDDKAKVDAYLADHPEAAVAVEAIRMTAKQLGDELMTELQDTPAVRIQRPAQVRRNWRMPAALAASVALVAGTYLALVGGVMKPTGSVVAVNGVSVDGLRKEAIDLTRRQKYAEALAVVDRMLAVDPMNDYANGARQLIADKANLQESKAVRGTHEYQFTKQLNSEERQKTYDDILRYPEGWANSTGRQGQTFALTDKREGESVTYKPGAPAGPLTLSPQARSQDETTTITSGTIVGVREKGGKGFGQGAGGDGSGGIGLAPAPRIAPKTGDKPTHAADSVLGIDMAGATGPGDAEVNNKRTGVPKPVIIVQKESVQKDFPLVKARDQITEQERLIRDGHGMGVESRSMREVERQLEELRARKADIQARIDRGETGIGTESYDTITDNSFLDVAAAPLSTFSIDVDTASYSNVRRFLNQGQLPPRDAVRIEEMLNYFPYNYEGPGDKEKPFAASVEIAACPWNTQNRLVRVGIKGREIPADQRPASNLVFLIDVSGSMSDANKLPLVKQSLRELVNKLDSRDRVAMVVYAGNSGLVLDSTRIGGNDEDLAVKQKIKQALQESLEKEIAKSSDLQGAERERSVRFVEVLTRKIAETEADITSQSQRTGRDAILAAIDRLQAGGSTNGGAGIELAYSTAQSAFIKDGTNRVILCTDGDFNVGITDQGALTRLIEEKAKGGVFLSVLGFGMGNTKDNTMENLADKGNGNYAYIDTQAEAKKVLVDQMSGTLVTIAKDVKIQIEFNPAKVQSYRLIGYENRLLAKEDFNNDKKDAGEIGAGHTVTAMYEVVTSGGKPLAPVAVDALKYQGKPVSNDSPEMLTLKLRYKSPDAPLEQGTSKLLKFPVTDAGRGYAQASGDFKFAAAVAGFGMILRESPHKGTATFASVLELAGEGKGEDAKGYRAEFLQLVERAKAISGK